MTHDLDGLDPLLGIRSVQTWADVKSDRHVRRLVHAGKLPKPDCRIGRGWRWKRSTLTRWLAEQCGGSRG
jgi:excisionase family DNA binding protein